MFEWTKEIDRLFQEEVDKKHIAGGQYLLLHKGKEVYYNTYGVADMEKGLKMGKGTIFRLFSMSKPITAVAVMILVERGMLDLREPVSTFLPCFHNQMVYGEDGSLIPANRDITVWDCLNMRSGVPYPEDWEDASRSGKEMDQLFKKLIAKQEGGEPISTLEYMEEIAKIPLVFQPGERWMYGLSADILGAVVEVCSGQSFGSFLQENIFKPLNMKDTGFFVPKEKMDRFAQSYCDDGEGGITAFTGCQLGEHYKSDVAFESGGAGLVSTLTDYERFARMLLNKGTLNGVRILSEQSVEFMTKDRMTDSQRCALNWDSNLGFGYGCLMRILVNPGEAQSLGSLGEFGWDGWTGNYFTISPKDDMIMFYIVQKCGYGFPPALRKIRNVSFAAVSNIQK